MMKIKVNKYSFVVFVATGGLEPPTLHYGIRPGYVALEFEIILLDSL